ncbi:MAG: DUF4249 family protein [Leadbetterella sp.]|nr:DUF4249 family protein [Leadbetterella sp.]
MRRYLFLLFCFISGLSSCVNVEDAPDIPDTSVYSMISPQDTLIEVFLAKVYRRADFIPLDSGKYIPDAKVYLFSKTDSLELKLNRRTKKYDSRNAEFIKNGETYYLKIYLENKILSAQTRVPDKYTPVITDISVSDNLATLSLEWSKSGDQKGLYRVLSSVDFDTNLLTGFFWGNTGGVLDTQDTYFKGEKIILTDGNFIIPENATKADLYFSHYSYDEAGYNFIRKLDVIQNRTEFLKHFEAPVFLEYNIDGGAIGVFGSFSNYEIRKTIRL